MKILGIVAALKAEAHTLTRKRLIADSVLKLEEGVVLKVAGIGATRAHAAAEALLAAGATALLSWGSAGALGPELSPGELVVPKTILLPSKATYATDAAWHRRLTARLAKLQFFHTGSLIQSPAILVTAAEKIALSRQYGAVAVDMESAAIAEVAGQAGVPFLAIRAIVDPRDSTMPERALSAINQAGRLQPLRLLGRLLRHPGELLPLIALGRNFRAAQGSLRAVAAAVGPSFAVRGSGSC